MAAGAESRKISTGLQGSVNEEIEEEEGITIAVPQLQTKSSKFFPTGFKHELKGLLRLSWPLLLTSLCSALLPTVSLLFCGQLGAVALDAVSLANSVINVTCLAVGMGLATACDTLFSQAFGGTNKRQVGVYLQKGILILALAIFPCWAIHLNTETLLRAIGQDEEVARLAGRYLIFYFPAVPFSFMYQVLMKYIQNQNIVLPSVIIGLVGNGVNAGLHYLLVYTLDLKTDGSALAQVGANVCFFVLTLLYIIISGVYKETWTPWSRDSLQNWDIFIKLAVPGMLMVCLEWWCFEIGTLMSGTLSKVDLGAQSVIFYVEGLAFQLPIGISIACSIRVGQFLGSGSSEAAKTSARVSYVLILSIAGVIAIFYIALRNYIPRAFTQDPAVVEKAAEILPVLAMFCVFEGLAGVGGGILRGCGRQTIGAIIIFAGYYLVALPIGLPLLILTEWKVLGLWFGYAAGIFVEAVAFSILIATTNWSLEAEQAQIRIGMKDDPLNEPETDSINEQEPIQEEEDSERNLLGPEPSEKTNLLASQSSQRKVSYGSKAGSRRNSLFAKGPPMARRYSASTLVTNLHGRRFSMPHMPERKYSIPTQERRFSTKYTPQIAQEVLEQLEQRKEMSLGKLVLIRLLTLGVCLLILGIGIALRLFVSYPYSQQPTCIPRSEVNGTLPTGIPFIPFCNTTMAE